MMEAPDTPVAADEKLFGQLSASSKSALTLANEVRGRFNSDDVRMEHLLYGLYAPHGGHTQEAFKHAGIETLDELLTMLNLNY